MDWNEIRVSSSKSMSDKLFDEISQRILSGELPEGYVFPNEAVLCEELRVGPARFARPIRPWSCRAM